MENSSSFFSLFSKRVLFFSFVAAFIIHMYIIIVETIRPEITNTKIFEENLVGAPLVFKICPEPAFNVTVLQKFGYMWEIDYISGSSHWNKSIYGWAGFDKNSTPISDPRDVYNKVALFTNVEDLLKW